MDITAIFPELTLFVGALAILMIDVFFGKKIKNPSHIAFLGSLIFSITSLITVILQYDSSYVIFNNTFFTNKFTAFVKIIALILLILVLFISDKFIKQEKRISAEFVSLMMIATTGAMLLISSNDLLPFYMALELQSLSLYILAAIRRNSLKSSESGMKYFLLGSVASGILLLGVSIVYGFSGTTNFSGLFYLINNGYISVGILLGLTLILTALLFKISAVPFHMWTPDVYEGSPTVITTFFASTIKFVSVLVLVRVYINIINIWVDINQILLFVAILSLIVGSLGAIKQSNFKRMLAYSGIGHIGFMLCGLAAINIEAIQATIMYIVIYSTLSLGSFAFLTLIISKNNEGKSLDQVNDKIYKISSIAGMSKQHPIISMSMAMIMFSMAGIPPFGGFFAKFYIIMAIISKELYFLAITAVLTSVISAFYYLRVVKVIYFDEKSDKDIEINSSGSGALVLIIMALVNLSALAFLKPLSSLIGDIL